jgi:aryl-alcohol dehydrogenase-like predicted oxidoreductase
MARFAGFTALGEVDALHEVVASGRFGTVQAYHNLLNPSASRPVASGASRASMADYRRLIPAAADRGMGVLNIRVLAAGLIGGREPPGRAGMAMSPGSDVESDSRRMALVEDALREEPGTMAQKSIRFALDVHGVSGVLVGFTTTDQVDEAAEAAALPALSESAMARLDALYRTDFGQYA